MSNNDLIMYDNGNFLEALQAISNEDLAQILKELTFYAEIRLSKFGFVPRTESDSISGADFAQEAFKLTIEGTRQWNSKNYPDVSEFLRMVVFSLIRNHLKKSKKTPVVLQDLDAEHTQSDDIGTEFIDFSSPDEVIISLQQWQKMEAAFGDDADGYIFFTDWLDDLPPREIAQKYNEEIAVIYRKIKKGKAIIKTIFSQ